MSDTNLEMSMLTGGEEDVPSASLQEIPERRSISVLAVAVSIKQKLNDAKSNKKVEKDPTDIENPPQDAAADVDAREDLADIDTYPNNPQRIGDIGRDADDAAGSNTMKESIDVENPPVLDETPAIAADPLKTDIKKEKPMRSLCVDASAEGGERADETMHCMDYVPGNTRGAKIGIVTLVSIPIVVLILWYFKDLIECQFRQDAGSDGRRLMSISDPCANIADLVQHANEYPEQLAHFKKQFKQWQGKELTSDEEQKVRNLWGNPLYLYSFTVADVGKKLQENDWNENDAAEALKKDLVQLAKKHNEAQFKKKQAEQQAKRAAEQAARQAQLQKVSKAGQPEKKKVPVQVVGKKKKGDLKCGLFGCFLR